MTIRRLKLAYEVYNFFNPKKLLHNVPLYKKYGINKHYFSSVSSNDFKNIAPSKFAENNIYVPQTPDFLTSENRTFFQENGYLIIPNYIDHATADTINTDIAALLEKKEIDFSYRNKLMFVFKKLPVLKSIAIRPKLINTLSNLFGGKAILFQSINFLTGSEQKTHSDSIHMTTFPLGGLMGAWIALEDIEADNGPLSYFPKSHKLPYYLNADYANEGSRFLLGDKDYPEYEKLIAEKIAKSNLTKQIFLAKKGDLLIWHANLLHGGEPHLNKEKTRKSVVFHYYKEHSICYHEITQRPALMD